MNNMSGEILKSDAPQRRIRKFNPGTLQSDQEIIQQFVVRSKEFELVKEAVVANIDLPVCQHLLIAAPRGRGKTMLLTRVAAEIRTDENLLKRLVPIQLMEENLEISNIAEFWLETLFHIAREISESEPEFASEIRKTYEDLCGRWGDRDFAEYARASVMEAAETIGRKIVLMVENLQTLVSTVDENFGWQLRAVLQSEPRIMLVATATSRFDELQDAEQPFFELFRLMDLKPLSTEECGRLWETVSGGEDSSVARNIRPLQILTGGNPRLLAIIAGFSRHRSIRQLMQDLVSLVDDHTEYFRGHIEYLPGKERRVYIAVLDLWRASTTSEIAARARMDIRVASMMLLRLEKRGAVVQQSIEGSNKRHFVASEPLYSIYYKLRRERDEAAVVESLIRFMVAFYDNFMLYGIFDKLWKDALESPSLLEGIDRALAGRPTANDDLRGKMLWDRLKESSEKAWRSRKSTAEWEFQDEMQSAFEGRQYERVIELVDQFSAKQWPTRYSSKDKDRDFVYFAHLRADAYLGMGEYQNVISIGIEVLDRFRTTRNVFIIYRSARVLQSKAAAHFQLEEYSEAIDCVNQLVDWIGSWESSSMQEIVAYGCAIASEAELNLNNTKNALRVLDHIIDSYSGNSEGLFPKIIVRALNLKANIVRCFENRQQDSISIFDKILEKYSDSKDPDIESSVNEALINRAFAKAKLRDFDGEISSYDEAIRKSSKDGVGVASPAASIAHAYKALRLAELNRIEDSYAACEEIERYLDSAPGGGHIWLQWMMKASRCMALQIDGHYVEALKMFHAAYTIFPAGAEIPIGDMIRVVLNLVAHEMDEREISKILESDKERLEGVYPLVVALRMRSGEIVREPTEVLEVAADIRLRIEEHSAKGMILAY